MKNIELYPKSGIAL